MSLFDDNADYAIGVALPDLKQYQENLEDECMHFTEQQARELPLPNLPVRANHLDDSSHVVGVIEAANVRSLQHNILLRVEPTVNEFSLYASNSIANGVYPSLSLSHRLPKDRPQRADGTIVKNPFEVSLVAKPWRPGSDLSHVFPGRASLERFSDATLAKYVDKFYPGRLGAPPQKESNTDDGARARYIEQLWTLVHTDRDRICREHSLLPNRRTLAMAESTPSTEIRASAAAAPPTPAAAEVAPPPEVSAPPPVEKPLIPGATDIDLHNVEQTARRLVETEEAMALMQKEQGELLKYKQEVEDTKAKERAAAIARSTTALESLLQWLGTNHSKEFAESQRQILEAQIAVNPEAAHQSIANTREMLVHASNATDAANRAAAEERASSARMAQEMQFTAFDRRREALAGGYGAPVALKSSPTGQLGASMGSRFPEAPPTAPLAEPPAQTAEPPAPVEKFGTEVRSFVEGTEVIEVRASFEENKKRKRGWAREAYANTQRALEDEGLGRRPTYEETGFGLVLQPSGEVRAGADGKREVRLNPVHSFNHSQRFGMKEFAPAALEASMRRLAGRQPSVIEGVDVPLR